MPVLSPVGNEEPRQGFLTDRETVAPLYEPRLIPDTHSDKSYPCGASLDCSTFITEKATRPQALATATSTMPLEIRDTDEIPYIWQSADDTHFEQTRRLPKKGFACSPTPHLHIKTTVEKSGPLSDQTESPTSDSLHDSPHSSFSVVHRALLKPVEHSLTPLSNPTGKSNLQDRHPFKKETEPRKPPSSFRRLNSVNSFASRKPVKASSTPLTAAVKTTFRVCPHRLSEYVQR